MLLTKPLFLIFSLVPGASCPQVFPRPTALIASLQADLKIETSYDAGNDKTTVRLAPVQISGEKGKYRSLQMSPAFSYSGKEPRAPEIIDFELRTVVRGRLDTDLYVLFMIDGEKVFLSSNRSAIKRPVPGRVWLGERLVFRMPYETFVKITKARILEIRFDDVKFSLSDAHLQLLRELGNHIQSETNPH